MHPVNDPMAVVATSFLPSACSCGEWFIYLPQGSCLETSSFLQLSEVSLHNQIKRHEKTPS